MSIAHSRLSRERLFLARTLLKQARSAETPVIGEALVQGATELALRARELLLVTIARYYQHKTEVPGSLAELADLIGSDAAEVIELNDEARVASGWWTLLDALDRFQSEPAKPKKSVSDDNIIAISASQGPDRSIATLESVVQQMEGALNRVVQRHDEW